MPKIGTALPHQHWAKPCCLILVFLGNLGREPFIRCHKLSKARGQHRLHHETFFCSKSMTLQLSLAPPKEPNSSFSPVVAPRCRRLLLLPGDLSTHGEVYGGLDGFRRGMEKTSAGAGSRGGVEKEVGGLGLFGRG